MWQPEIKKGCFGDIQNAPYKMVQDNISIPIISEPGFFQEVKQDIPLIKLRPYQEECLQAINEAFQNGTTRQLINIPTGGGKTVIFASLIDRTKRKTLVIAHTLELLNQSREKIEMICPNLKVGLVNADKKEFYSQVVISSIQSARQPENLIQLQQQDFSLLVYDETHHICSDSARMVVNSLGFGKGTNKLLCGFTATPSRTDSRGLGEDFDAIVFSKSIKSMIRDGYLCPPRGIKIATDLDLSNVDMGDYGDFREKSLAAVMDTDEINELVSKTYMEKASGRKAICFGVSIAHAVNLAKYFNAQGIKSESIHGSMAKCDREQVLERFKNNDLQVITNCQVLTEGFDCCSVDCVIVARPTKSKGLYTQMAGRGLRLWPNKKDCLILDFGDVNHSLCSTELLVGDAEAVAHEEINERMISLALSLPPTINQKLKSAILEFDLLGDSFTWQKDFTGNYFLKGNGVKLLKILQSAPDRFDVIFEDKNNVQVIAKDLSFEYAFATAEGYAKENRSHFVLSDLDAPWRKEPISEKQKQIFRSKGFKCGIDDMTKGQASTIISSGILNK